MITLHQVAPNTLLGFKALPTWRDSNTVLDDYHQKQQAALRSCAAHRSPSSPAPSSSSPAAEGHTVADAARTAAAAPIPDWSGLYVQLSFRSAVHYLPNQWDRGEQQAQLAAVYTAPHGPPLCVLCCSNPQLADASISSADKARLLREGLHTFFTTTSAAEAVPMPDARAFPPLDALLSPPSGGHGSETATTAAAPSTAGSLSSQAEGSVAPFPLLAALGLYGYALCLPDAEANAYELVLPHLLHIAPPSPDARVTAAPLFHLTASTRLPGCTGAVREVPTLPARDAVDPVTLAAVLLQEVVETMGADTIDATGTVQWWATLRR